MDRETLKISKNSIFHISAMLYFQESIVLMNNQDNVCFNYSRAKRMYSLNYSIQSCVIDGMYPDYCCHRIELYQGLVDSVCPKQINNIGRIKHKGHSKDVPNISFAFPKRLNGNDSRSLTNST